MICADFLAGAHLDNGTPEILLSSMSRYYKFVPGEQQQAFLFCETKPTSDLLSISFLRGIAQICGWVPCYSRN